MHPGKKLLIVLILTVLVFAVICAIFIYSSRYRLREVASYDCPFSEDVTLTIFMQGEPVFPYGPTYCRAILRVNGRIFSREDITLPNDGAAAGEENFSVRWEKDRVYITARADEMEDTQFVLFFE